MHLRTRWQCSWTQQRHTISWPTNQPTKFVCDCAKNVVLVIDFVKIDINTMNKADMIDFASLLLAVLPARRITDNYLSTALLRKLEVVVRASLCWDWCALVNTVVCGAHSIMLRHGLLVAQAVEDFNEAATLFMDIIKTYNLSYTVGFEASQQENLVSTSRRTVHVHNSCSHSVLFFLLLLTPHKTYNTIPEGKGVIWRCVILPRNFLKVVKMTQQT